MIKALWEKLVGKQQVQHVIKIVNIKGEVTPGYISVDIGAFTQEGKYIDGNVRTLDVKIHPSARPSINRILSGESTNEDQKVLSIAVFRHPDCTFKRI
jgi:hypothetical protein